MCKTAQQICRLSTVLMLPVIFLSSIGLAAGQSSWHMANGPLQTRWAKDVSPANALPEYPRPQLVRRQWVNLNGLWDFALQNGDAPPGKFDSQILVPFPVESQLSGIRRLPATGEGIWYRRSFNAPAFGKGRLLLHFGAVMNEVRVWVNGKEVGTHAGGYESFTLDITDAVKPGAANELLVRAVVAARYHPMGKQSGEAFTHPSGMFYTSSSGIWQTVWLEPVPATYISDLNIVPDVNQSLLKITPQVAGAPADGATVEVIALEGGKEISRASGAAGTEIAVKIPRPHLWSPDDPFLYDLRIVMSRGGKVVDQVSSYAGLRKISLGEDDKGFVRILLNDKSIFQAGVLDQGFWPDGVYTAPTDEALRYDIEVLKKMGINMVRMHTKVETDRWYYWCDKLGLLVWQDMVGHGPGKVWVVTDPPEKVDPPPLSAEEINTYETELDGMIQQLHNHPSIVMWILFNEGWGQTETARLTLKIKKMDSTRLVDQASGWVDRGGGDVMDAHTYPGPNCPRQDGKRAAVLGEFGGSGCLVDNHVWATGKYLWIRHYMNTNLLNDAWFNIWQKTLALRDDQGLCAAVFTQIADTEMECNGIMTYDRAVIKVNADETKAALLEGKFPPPPTYHPIMPAAFQAISNWRYMINQPGADWVSPDFDASAWKEGPGGFGGESFCHTPWTAADIWVRREFELKPQDMDRNIILLIACDDDADVYINGVSAVRVPTDGNYQEFPISKEARATMKPGKNMIAIHTHQTVGAQYIDAGLETRETTLP